MFFLLAVLHPADQLRVHGDRAERHHDRLQRPRRQGRQRGKQAQSKVVTFSGVMLGCVISLLTQPLDLQAIEAAAAQHHGDLDAGDGGARLPRLPQRQGTIHIRRPQNLGFWTP